jgi:Ecdysteroid kinase-like family
MFDFQEVRFASPVVDLSYLMYMNIHSSLMPQVWDRLLEVYHETLITSLTEMLDCKKDDPRLAPYAFDKFCDHYSRHAFYGVMVAISFIPYMASPEDVCARMAELCEQDHNDPELESLSKTCGGKDVDERLVNLLLHASEKGYMKIFNGF